jgi:hypothetical protein
MPKDGEEAGTPFTYPIDVKLDDSTTLYVEGNFDKDVGLFHLARLLKACGLSVDVPGERPEQQNAAPTSTEPDATSTSSSRAIVVILEGQQVDDSNASDSRRFEGKNVRDLLTQVIGHLIQKRGRPFYELLERDSGVLMGRSRYFVAWSPFHQGGAPFRASQSIKVDDHLEVYVEVALSREEAQRHLTTLCANLGYDCQTQDIDDEEDDELDRESVTSNDLTEAGASADSGSAALDARKNLSIQVNPDLTIEGSTVRAFFTKVLDWLASSGALGRVALPLPPWDYGGRVSKRYLLATEARHPNGREFSNPMSFAWTGGVLQVELNWSRADALKAGEFLVAKARRRADEASAADDTTAVD